MLSRSTALLAAGGSLAVGIAGMGPAHAGTSHEPDQTAGTAAADCFWFGPTARLDDPDDNYAFPDGQARY